MPLFVFLGRDGSRGTELRPTHRPGHLAGLEALERAGRIVHAGPLVDDDGAPIGSVIVFEAADLAEARAFAARDPYVTEGIFSHHEVRETRRVFPRS